MNPIVHLDVNKTTIFLLPMLFPNSTYNEIFSNYLKQAYIGLLDDKFDEHEMVLIFDDDKASPEQIENFIENIDYKGELIAAGSSIDDNMLILRINDELDRQSYDNFLKGRYSLFSEDYKNTILEFWEEDDNSLLKGILTNNRDLVEELQSIAGRSILHEIESLNDESWPPPNLLVDEFYVI